MGQNQEDLELRKNLISIKNKVFYQITKDKRI